MGLKERFQRKITLKLWEIQLLIISTLFFTLFLIITWPRFRSDAMSIAWYWYLILFIVVAVPVFKKILSEKEWST